MDFMIEGRPWDISQLRKLLRRDIIQMAEHSAHVAVALSCVDIIGALHFCVMRSQDHFILSKGHGVMAMYAVLAALGRIDRKELESYGQDGSRLAEHPLAMKVPGIEFATGSLGHGLPIAAGMAKGLQLSNSDGRVFALLGDGECDEGAVWEAAAAASAQSLHNLVAFVDVNGLQACGPTSAISRGVNLENAWRSFGWTVAHCDGHDWSQLSSCVAQVDQSERPVVILCSTIKGCGVSFMENDLEWHYRPVGLLAREAALKELQDA